METMPWKYADSVCAARQEYLLNPPSFDDISQQILEEMTILECMDDDCKIAEGFSRAVFLIQVSNKLFDLFFNSCNGYRAYYYQAVEQGLQRNRYFISTITGKLLQFHAKEKSLGNDSDADQQVRESLRSYSAKVWCDEICEWKMPQDYIAEILNDRWEHKFEADCSNGHEICNAKSGKKAPFLSRIKVFGAFVNARYDEFIPARKRFRAEDIHRFGWS